MLEFAHLFMHDSETFVGTVATVVMVTCVILVFRYLSKEENL